MSEETVQMDAERGEAPEAAPEGGEAREGGERQVPVTEAIRYRKRAQAAEQQLQEMQGRLSSLEGELSESRQTIEQLERREKIDALLGESEAVDLEAARLLTERAVAQMDEPDVQSAVAELRRQKPYLFRQPAGSGGAMAARYDPPPQVDEAAAQAAASGDRRDLLRYLRLKRAK